MTPILKTVNLATLNYAQAILKEADIPFFTMDENVSIIEGSIGIIPRRLMVLDDDFEDAADVFKCAGLLNQIPPP